MNNERMRRTLFSTLLSSFIFFAFNSSAYASSLEAWHPPGAWHPVVSGSVGMAFSTDVGNSAIFPPNSVSSETYNYTAGHGSQSSYFFNAFLGAEWDFKPNWGLQAGLNYTQTSPFLAQGTYTQGVDVTTESSFSYNYNISSRQALVESKLLYTFKERYHPYVLVGLGVAFNHSYNYNISTPAYLSFTRNYANSSDTSFSYMVGAGIDANITEHFRAGIGYSFADLGQAKLGGASVDGTPVPGTLSQSHLYASQIFLQATEVF